MSAAASQSPRAPAEGFKMSPETPKEQQTSARVPLSPKDRACVGPQLSSVLSGPRCIDCIGGGGASTDLHGEVPDVVGALVEAEALLESRPGLPRHFTRRVGLHSALEEVPGQTRVPVLLLQAPPRLQGGEDTSSGNALAFQALMQFSNPGQCEGRHRGAL